MCKWYLFKSSLKHYFIICIFLYSLLRCLSSACIFLHSMPPWANTRVNKNVRFNREERKIIVFSKTLKVPAQKFWLIVGCERVFCCRGFSKQPLFFLYPFVSLFLFYSFLSYCFFLSLFFCFILLCSPSSAMPVSVSLLTLMVVLYFETLWKIELKLSITVNSWCW